jgi:hypothetical protein
MSMKFRSIKAVGFGLLFAAPMFAQPPGGGFPGGAPPGGFGGPPGGATRKILKEFDKNNDGWLNAEERKPAREAAAKGGGPAGGMGRGPGGRGPGGMGGNSEPSRKGATIKPEEVKTYTGSKLYDLNTLRTIFLEFENPDWEKELQDFHGTDVDVPATATIDGRTYPTVGVHFRGMSSYMGVPATYKRSLNLSFDMADPKQRVYGAKTLNLLNGHEDSSMMSTVLYSHIARQYIPAPKANFVRVVINGECWGVYTSVEQFDKEFLKDNYKGTKGTRWKVRGSPGGGGGLEYLGDRIDDYKRRYEMKTGDGTDEKAWKALVLLCKTLNETPADKLEEALKPMLDLEEVLKFLALDNALINCDGYWIRASDYTIFLDEAGKFHLVPHDMNEAFRSPQGPGMGGGRGPAGPGGGRPGGPGGNPFLRPMPPIPGTILPEPLADQLKLTPEQKKELAILQKATDEMLGKILTEEQRKQFDEIKKRPPDMVFGPGPGGMDGPGGGMVNLQGVELDPLVGLADGRKPLRSKLLAVPSLKAKYLGYVREIAGKSMDWKALGPVVADLRKLIEKDLEADPKKLGTFEQFQRLTADTPAEGRGREMPLRSFADQRRKYLLAATEPKKGD